MINVTKTFLPSFEEYTSILKRAWDQAWITNQGVLARELEDKLKQYNKVEHLLFCSNGTIVLQMALKALDITKEVLTTPFSYVATTNAILWEGAKPVFVDICHDTFCIDADKIEALITPETQAILATHVYGYPCNIEKIEEIANKYNLKVIYDGAHTFGCIYKNRALLSYGDISTCSFHATKIFHTGEGGCIISNNDEVARRLFLYRSFGHVADDYYSIGINAKNSEFHAAMGLAVLPQLESIMQSRKSVFERYLSHFERSAIKLPYLPKSDFKYNYAYFPVVFKDEDTLLRVRSTLQENQINTRRYFYPSLNNLSFHLFNHPCPVSEDLSLRVLCLPMYAELSMDDVDRISQLVLKSL